MFYQHLNDNNSCVGLLQLIKEIVKPNFAIVEIGSFSGVSSELFAKHCDRLVCVDIWTSDPHYNEIDKNIIGQAWTRFQAMAKDYDNIMPIMMGSEDAVKMFKDNSIDMVYIDGRHDYASVKKDINNWISKVKPGGWVTGHDIKLDGDRVNKAVTEIFGNYYKEYIDESWAIQI